MKKIIFVLGIILISLLNSCVKEEGLGGNATIEGKVYVLDYNMELTQKLGEFYGSDIDVFIIYGEDSVYSDDFKTSYDGSYRFKNLRVGEYKVFAYSEDTTAVSESYTFPVFKNISITHKDQVVNVEDIVIVK
jgi:hypothetical protein